MAIVEVKDYSFRYVQDADTFVLRQVSFTVEEGAFCVVVGPTGCGKSTLLRSLKPELVPVGERSGLIRVCGAVLADGDKLKASAESAMSSAESAANIGFVAQDPEVQLVCDTVWHELAFGLENLGTPQNEMRRRVAEVAHFFGIEPWIHHSVETLSGGQKQLVNLAAVLALRPRLLLLDEPTAQLDPNACRKFLFMLARVNRELGITVVVATHAPEEMELYATQQVVLGGISSVASRGQAVSALTKWEEKSKCADNTHVWPSADLSPLQNRTNAALVARDVYFRYDKRDSWVLRGVDFMVYPGSVHAVVGGNGCGKSTLLALLAGIRKPQRGSVRNYLQEYQAFLPQDPKTLFVCDTVLEEVQEWGLLDTSRWGRRAWLGERTKSAEQLQCAERTEGTNVTQQDETSLLQQFGLEECAAMHPYDLSGGQQQKLALTKALLHKPQLLFMDEPTKGLDPASCADVLRMIRTLAKQGCTIVLVTHDLDFASLVADSVTMLFDGQIACTELADEFFHNNMVYRPHEKSRLYGAMLS